MRQIKTILVNIVLHEQLNTYHNTQQLSISEASKDGPGEKETDRTFDFGLYGSVGGIGIIGTNFKSK